MPNTQTLHTATAFDAAASALAGATFNVAQYAAVLVWFDPGGSYDGTALFEVSPDAGTTWFPIDGEALNDRAVPIPSVASPTDAVLYRISVPSFNQFRVRMSGGSQGTLTVYAQPVYGGG